MRWHRFLKWRCKCGQRNSADQSLRNFGNCFHLTLAVENFEDVVERIGLIFVLGLFLGLFRLGQVRWLHGGDKIPHME